MTDYITPEDRMKPLQRHMDWLLVGLWVCLVLLLGCLIALGLIVMDWS